VTPIVSATPTSTVTGTATPSSTVSPTRTITSTATHTSTVTPTYTITNTFVPTNTPLPTNTWTPTPTVGIPTVVSASVTVNNVLASQSKINVQLDMAAPTIEYQIVTTMGVLEAGNTVGGAFVAGMNTVYVDLTPYHGIHNVKVRALNSLGTPGAWFTTSFSKF
jgi:hypothetical protein